MKKRLYRINAVILTALMLLPLAACNGAPEQTSDVSGEDTPAYTDSTATDEGEQTTDPAETVSGTTAVPEQTTVEAETDRQTDAVTTDTEPEQTTAEQTTQPQTSADTTTVAETTAPQTTEEQTTAPQTTAKQDDPPADTVYTTSNGIKYTVSGQSKESGGKFTVTKNFVISFEDNTLSTEFNRFSLTYSSGKPLRIFIKYNVSGKDVTDDYYLEAGQNVTFNGLISSYLQSGRAKNVKTVTVQTCDGKQTEFSISKLSSELVKVYNEKIFYIENARFKVGIQLSWGGGLNYIQDKKSTVSGLTNLVNQHDTGRLIQQSYYGTGGNSEYKPGTYNGSTWAYNPVQGGDQYGNPSRLIDVIVKSDSVYIKAQPQDWSLNNQISRSYMENTYTLTSDYIRVDNRFVDFSGWEHRYAHQELPAFYTVSYLDRFVWYNGTKPWTDDALSYRDDLGFWGDARYSDDCRFPMKNENTETWGAWVSPASNFGIGLYVPSIDMLYAGRYSYNGSKSASDGATNYIAPLNMLKLVSYDPIEYSYLLTTGSTEQIREVFKKNKDFASNASLHKNYVSMRVADIDYTSIDFSNEASATAINTPNNTEITYSSAQKAMRLRVTKAEDPQTFIDFSASSTQLNAQDYKTIEIEYMIPSSNKQQSYVTDLFLCTGSKTSPDGSERVRGELIKDGKYHTLSIDVSSLPFWSGKINKIRFDYFDACAVNDVIYIKSFKLK